MFRRFVAVAIMIAALFTGGVQPALSWEKARGVPYNATSECPDADNLCVFVSCPAMGKPAFELLMYEHGRGTGEEIIIEVDGKPFPLALPEAGAHDLYRWALQNELAAALRDGRRARIVIDPGTAGAPISLRGSGRAIQSVMAACGGSRAGSQPAIESVAVGPLGGLSDNEDCAYATTEGVVTSRMLTASGREVEGFRFKDQFGNSYINISLPENLPRARGVHQQLLKLLVEGQRLRIGVHGCGAAGSIEVLDAVEALS